MACDSRESSKSICKEIALQRPKTGKFDYLGRPNYPAHSIAFKFFTNDKIGLPYEAVTYITQAASNEMNSGHGPFGERAQQRAPQVPFYLDEPHYYLFQETRKGSTCSGFELLGINRSFVVRIGRLEAFLDDREKLVFV